MENKCSIDDCSQECTNSRYDGKLYCSQHYVEMFMRDFSTLYQNWDIGAEPSVRFKRILGRFHDEFCHHKEESYLTAARIRDRGFNFQKTENGCAISITRHLYAWTDDRPSENFVENWEANFSYKLW